MKNYDALFQKEKEKIDIKARLAADKKQAKLDVIVNFCNEGLFDFLEYLDNKFYVRKHGVNHHVDRAVYTCDMVYNFKNREHAIERIKTDVRGCLRTGIQYKWVNGSIYDSLTVRCVDFKPVLEYEGKRMDLDTFMEVVVAQIQKAINENSPGFQIIEK